MVGAPTEVWNTVGDIYGERSTLLRVPEFAQQDYAAVARNILGEERVKSVDFALLHRHASQLNGRQLRLMCELVSGEGELNTSIFVKCLEDFVLRSNLNLHEVEALEFNTLPGSEHIVEALETNVVLPFENPELAASLGIKPKRGVLLYGPPGTGKTSIGRALAHRMKGKFFLIDGNFVTEPPGAFMGAVHAMVNAAKANAPAVLFIDDADVLFNIEHVGGLARYLLTVLDGLESEGASHVCVMMTAMDVRKVPKALTRSGRVELWLETRPPDEATRARILSRWLGDALPGSGDADLKRLAAMTEGFTPADLRRISGDARLLYANDIVTSRDASGADEYLSAAIRDIVEVRSHMAAALEGQTLNVDKGI
jgi:ATP-dependent 26S proteasome regulatory subunit